MPAGDEGAPIGQIAIVGIADDLSG